jgi:hypothetical protein
MLMELFFFMSGSKIFATTRAALDTTSPAVRNVIECSKGKSVVFFILESDKGISHVLIKS